MSSPPMGQNWEDVFFTARDGLRLYARRYGVASHGQRPVVCLAGLTRNSRDFHDLATYLSSPDNSAAREVWTIDARGRGRSAADPDWRHYTLPVEMHDVLDLMTLAGLSDAAIIGTSRGGLIAMLMAIARPTMIGAVVLNDIGPVLEREGLLRIVAYVGRVPLPATWDEAAALVRDMNAKQFPAVPEHHWADIARQWFNDEHGRPMHSYDQNLARAVTVLDEPIPEMWPQFDALRRVPALVIRGALSDILSEKTVGEMRLRHPDLSALTVKGQGHAPLLRDQPTQQVIADFLKRADATPDVASRLGAALARR